MEKTVNLNMIILARESRGWNQAELAEKIGMTPTNLSKIERNDINIHPDHLQAVAQATHYPLHFFYQPGTIMPENLVYRKKENVPQKLLTPVYAQANIIRLHAQFVTRALGITTPNLPTWEVTATNTPAKIATRLRQKWELDKPIIDNITRLLEKHGILVYSFAFGTERVDSKTISTDDGIPVICINSLLQGDRQRFSLAHQLGQLVMHSGGKIAADRDINHEANLFAAEFLMPAKDIAPDYTPGITVSLLGELKRKWKVSMIALLYRAADLDLLTDNQKKYLVQQFNKLRIRRREPAELDIPFEQPRLLQQYIAQYKTKAKLGTSEMAALLCLEVNEFLDLYG